MGLSRPLARALATACFALCAASTAAPAAAEDFYHGKQIRLIVGSDTGGGYDAYARLIARHWPEFIPGAPSIVAQNMAGAGSMITANYVYNIANPEGLTMGAIFSAL